MARSGISRVAIEVIILVIAIALALLIFSPIGSYIFGALGRTSTVAGTTTISVLSVHIDGSGDMTIYAKNLGPSDIALNACCDPSKDWQVFVDNEPGTVATWYVQPPGGDFLFDVDEVAAFEVFTTGGYSDRASYSILAYGPGGIRTQHSYRGG